MNRTRADFLRRQKRRKRGKRRMEKGERQQTLKKVAGFLGCALIGVSLGGMFLMAFAFDDYEPPSPPKNYGEIEYHGVWREPEDYEQMMAKNEAEQEAEHSLIQTVCTQAEPAIIYSMDWGTEDSYLLAKIAMAEAEGEDTEGKALVMLTVLNRVWADGFPDTISEVIFEDGAFSSVSNGRWDRVEPNEDYYKALELIMFEHWDESQGALYFERNTEESTWHSRNLEKIFVHGNHTFYKEMD